MSDLYINLITFALLGAPVAGFVLWLFTDHPLGGGRGKEIADMAASRSDRFFRDRS